MTWLERMNEALDYIEENLDGTIDMGKIAQITCQSVSGFQRVFSIISDLPLSEYIRRRRLTQAAFELQNSTIKVIDLAYKYGYDSPEAFTRAFNIIHGTTPSSARDIGVSLKAYPRISFLLTIKGVEPMDYKIQAKEQFTVYGIEGIFSCENGENLQAIPKFWGDIMEDGRFNKLLESTGMPEIGENDLCAINAICDYRKNDGDRTFPYMIFAFKTDVSNTKGYTEVTVPAATWALFKSETHKIENTSTVLQGLIKRVYTDWLPTAAFEKVDGHELELYYGNGDKCWCEVWIKVIPKK